MIISQSGSTILFQLFFTFEDHKMATATEQIELVRRWCHEAVREFGDDWPSIHGHIRKKLAELPETERKSLLQNVVLALMPDCDKH